MMQPGMAAPAMPAPATSPRPVPSPVAGTVAAPVPAPMQAPVQAPARAYGGAPAPAPAALPQGASPQPHVPQPHAPQAPAHLGLAPQVAAPSAAPASAPLGALSAPGALPLGALPLGAAEPEHREEGERALPAVTFHSFCERQDTAGIINQTTRDWRMARTTSKIFMGGLPAAVEFYRKETTPALVIIETGMRGAELFTQLDELAGVCDENTQVVVIGAANDIRLYRQLMEKGVSDYLVPPLSPLGLIRSLGELYLDPDAPFTGRVAAFFGCKGGVGSSMVAHNVAWQLSESHGQDVALVDLDTSFGTTGLDLHYEQTSGLEEALADPDRLDDALLDRILIRHTPHLSLLPASGGLGRVALSPEACETLVNTVRGVVPTTILDLPGTWSDWSQAMLAQADDVVLTATLDLASLRNTKNVVDFLRSKRPNDPDPILVINKVGLPGGIDVEAFASAVGLQPSVTFGFDPDVFLAASNNGEMISEAKAGGTVEGFQRLGTRLRTGRMPELGGSKGSLGRVGSLLGRGKDAKEGVAKDASESASGESKSVIMKLLKRG